MFVHLKSSEMQKLGHEQMAEGSESNLYVWHIWCCIRKVNMVYQTKPSRGRDISILSLSFMHTQNITTLHTQQQHRMYSTKVLLEEKWMFVAQAREKPTDASGKAQMCPKCTF